MSTKYETLWQLATEFYDSGKVNEANSYYQQALGIINNDENKLQDKAYILMSLGVLHTEQLDKVHDGINYYQQALAIIQNLGEQETEADCLQNLGIAHKTIGELDTAKLYYQQAFEIFEKANPSKAEYVKNNLLF